MLFFPTTVVDNFFDNPDKIRQIALEQSYDTDRHGVINGLRSKPFTVILPELQEQIREKILSLFYDLDRDYVETKIRCYFHKNTPYHKGDNMGWIHNDLPDSIIAGLIYLTPNPDPDSGTSLFKLIKDWDQETFKKAHAIKKRLYRDAHFIHEPNTDDVDFIEEFDYWRSKWDEYFEETVTINNVYNRMILYDSEEFHAPNKFVEDRLALVFFITELKSKTTPIDRIKQVHK